MDDKSEGQRARRVTLEKRRENMSRADDDYVFEDREQLIHSDVQEFQLFEYLLTLVQWWLVSGSFYCTQYCTYLRHMLFFCTSLQLPIILIIVHKVILNTKMSKMSLLKFEDFLFFIFLYIIIIII